MNNEFNLMAFEETELAHFNPFHNPKNGQFASRNGGSKISKSGLSAKEKDVLKKAKGAAAAAAAISGAVTLGKALNDQRIFNKAGLGGKINPIARTYEGITKAGKASTMAALAVIGGYTVKDYVTKQPKSERIRPLRAYKMAKKSDKSIRRARFAANTLVTGALAVYGYRKVKDLMKNKYVEGGLPYYG